MRKKDKKIEKESDKIYEDKFNKMRKKLFYKIEKER
jgi:hypothetical protein